MQPPPNPGQLVSLWGQRARGRPVGRDQEVNWGQGEISLLPASPLFTGLIFLSSANTFGSEEGESNGFYCSLLLFQFFQVLEEGWTAHPIFQFYIYIDIDTNASVCSLWVSLCIYMYIEAKCCLFLWSVKEGRGGQQTCAVCKEDRQRAGWAS